MCVYASISLSIYIWRYIYYIYVYIIYTCALVLLNDSGMNKRTFLMKVLEKNKIQLEKGNKGINDMVTKL